MKGIILAGGSGTRLYPMTSAFSKHLLHVYDKPMLYYSLAVLMDLGIRDIIMISTKHDKPIYENIFGDGSRLGIKIRYVIQEKPNGLAEGFILSEEYFKGHKVCMILGDNIFYVPKPQALFDNIKNFDKGGVIFGHHVKDPERYGVVEMDSNGHAISIEEKPQNPKSNLAIPGLYFYDEDVFEIARNVKPSARGELEITCISEAYMRRGDLKVHIMENCFWLDSGTSDSLLEASNFIAAIEHREDIKIACLERIAIEKGFVSRDSIKQWLEGIKSKSSYIEWLRNWFKK